MPDNGITIYVLAEKITADGSPCRYIGQTCRKLRTRLKDHLAAARRTKKNWVGSWIAKAQAAGREIRIAAVDWAATQDEADNLERMYIAAHRRSGVPITNVSDGGISGPMNEEWRRRISAAKEGIVFSAEHRRNISLARRGLKLSEETKALCGRSGSLNHNAKLSEADVALILNLLRVGVSTSRLAGRYGVSRSLVGHIKNGRSWTHVRRPK